jgi:uncharacterized protein YxeA
MKKIILIVIILLVLSCLSRVLIKNNSIPQGRYEVLNSFKEQDGNYSLKISDGVETYTIRTDDEYVAKANHIFIKTKITPCP